MQIDLRTPLQPIQRFARRFRRRKLFPFWLTPFLGVNLVPFEVPTLFFKTSKQGLSVWKYQKTCSITRPSFLQGRCGNFTETPDKSLQILGKSA
jgi:hypothetical protein